MSCVSNVVVIHHACNVYIACITHSAFGTKLCGLVAHAAMEGINHQLSTAKLHYTLHIIHYMYTTVDTTSAYYIYNIHIYSHHHPYMVSVDRLG